MNISLLPENQKKSFRTIENLIIKEEKLKSHITFKMTYILNNFLSKYVNFNLHDQLAQKEREIKNSVLY